MLTETIPSVEWIRLTQGNGKQNLPIIIRRSAIISVSPALKDETNGRMVFKDTLIMLLGDQRPVRVVEQYGTVMAALGIGGWGPKGELV